MNLLCTYLFFYISLDDLINLDYIEPADWNQFLLRKIQATMVELIESWIDTTCTLQTILVGLVEDLSKGFYFHKRRDLKIIKSVCVGTNFLLKYVTFSRILPIFSERIWGESTETQKNQTRNCTWVFLNLFSCKM